MLAVSGATGKRYALVVRSGPAYCRLLSVLVCFAARGRPLILGTTRFAARGQLLILGASPSRNRFLNLLSVVLVSFAARGRLLILGTAFFAARGRLLILGAVILAMLLVSRRLLPFLAVAARSPDVFC